jgi:toxin ParE1/3/4
LPGNEPDSNRRVDGPFDIDDIWNYTAKRRGGVQAGHYAGQIWRQIAMIAGQPGIGRACPEIRTGYDKSPAGSHVLFYRRVAHGVEVVRILHERMDLTRHF